MTKILIDRAVVEQALLALRIDDLSLVRESVIALRAALEQPQVEQEPVATVSIVIDGPRTTIDTEWNDRLAELPAGTHQLYTHPQPPRQPLTDEEIDKLDWGPRPDEPMSFKEALREFARAIEAAHGVGGKK